MPFLWFNKIFNEIKYHFPSPLWTIYDAHSIMHSTIKWKHFYSNTTFSRNEWYLIIEKLSRYMSFMLAFFIQGRSWNVVFHGEEKILEGHNFRKGDLPSPWRGSVPHPPTSAPPHHLSDVIINYNWPLPILL